MLKLEGIFKGSFSSKVLFYRVEAETQNGEVTCSRSHNGEWQAGFIRLNSEKKRKSLWICEIKKVFNMGK